MNPDPLFSVRMRASRENRHLSGAERLVPSQMVVEIVQLMVKRALSRPTGPDEIVVSVDPVHRTSVRSIRSLDLISLRASDADECRAIAVDRLVACGVALPAVMHAIELLGRGPSRNGGVMRGALVMDARSGERREQDRDRGIRVSRVDWSDDASAQVRRTLRSLGLSHFRTQEALALASKAALAPGMIAELCWSDDPDYVAGYIADRQGGYLRLPVMKRRGDPMGGRVFFIAGHTFDLQEFTSYLQDVPVLITSLGCFTERVPPSREDSHA